MTKSGCTCQELNLIFGNLPWTRERLVHKQGKEWVLWHVLIYIFCNDIHVRTYHLSNVGPQDKPRVYASISEDTSGFFDMTSLSIMAFKSLTQIRSLIPHPLYHPQPYFPSKGLITLALFLSIFAFRSESEAFCRCCLQMEYLPDLDASDLFCLINCCLHFLLFIFLFLYW